MVLSGMLNSESYLEVVDTAQTPEELFYKAYASKPDIIVAHSRLTLGDSLPFFQLVHKACSSLLLIVSDELTHQFNPLNRKYKSNTKGNYGLPAENLSVLKEAATSILYTIRELITACLPSKPSLTPEFVSTRPQVLPVPMLDIDKNTAEGKTKGPLCVVVGASTGGSMALEYLIRDLRSKSSVVVLVAVHMPAKFTKRLAKRLQKMTEWEVKEGIQGMALQAGTVVIAPGGCNMLVREKPFHPTHYYLELTETTALESPSIDHLFHSAAHCVKKQVLGIILTGMGHDGTVGSLEIKAKGGVVITQDQETSSMFGMAKSAIDSGAVAGVFALGQINSIINKFVADRNKSLAVQTEAIG